MKIIDRRRLKPLAETGGACGAASAFFLRPFYVLSLIYAGLVTAWRALPARQVRPGVPVISIGSIIVGGTGKTPLCMLVAEMLASSGRKVCVISRGYMRKGRRSPLVVSDGKKLFADVREAGDEPYLLARRLPGVQVIVDKDRVRAAEKALSGGKPDALVLDDGFQTKTLAKALEIVCLDAESLLKRQFFIPLGRLREGWGAIRPDHVVVVKLEQGEAAPDPSVFGRLPTPLVFLARRERPALLDADGRPVGADAWTKHRFLALSGVARPAAFERACAGMGLELTVGVRADDHHWYGDKDVKEIIELMETSGSDRLVTTEKDFYRLPEALRTRALVLRDQLAMEDPVRFAEMLETRLRK